MTLGLKHVLVTGGAGFIGTHLVRQLLGSHIRVTVIDRISRPVPFPTSKSLTYLRVDAQNLNAIAADSSRNSGIVHLAAETSVEESIRHPLSSVRSNIGATCAALEFARKTDAKRFVFASTAAVYGDRNGLCRETDSCAPLSPYAVSKLASEHYCNMYYKLYRIPTVILRYFNVYGPGQSSQYSGVITSFVKRVIRGKPPVIFGDGDQTRDFVFVDDVVKATMDSLWKGLPGAVINIGSGRQISIASLADRILRMLHKKKLRPIHTSPRRGDVRHSLADVSLARRKIGFRPSHDLDDGLRATIEWLRWAN